MTYKDLYLKLIPLYEPSEARAIVRMLLETEFGFSQPTFTRTKLTNCQLSIRDYLLESLKD